MSAATLPRSTTIGNLQLHQPALQPQSVPAETTTARYVAAREERKYYEREARQIKKTEDALGAELMEYARTCGAFVEDGYCVRVGEKRSQVSWKSEFIRVAGEAEAARLMAECELVDELLVEPI